MSRRRELLRKEPYRFSFLGLLRDFERSAPDKPRIGASTTLKEEIVSLGQDPYLEFPASNVTAFLEPEGKLPNVRSRFLGFFGPHGALPLWFTEEASGWLIRRNVSFIRFTDLFAGRFLQLFYRVWTRGRPITQFDRPDDDSFQEYVGAAAGIPVGNSAPRDALGDYTRLHFAGLLSGRVKSPMRLKQALEAAFRVPIEIEEHVPSWISFESDDLAKLGDRASELGVNLHLGSRVLTVNDKIRVHVHTRTRAQYESFLPGGINYAMLSDLALGYVSPAIQVEVAPSLPRHALSGASLNGQAALGRTGWISPDTDSNPDQQVSDAVFAALDQRTRHRNHRAAA